MNGIITLSAFIQRHIKAIRYRHAKVFHFDGKFITGCQKEFNSITLNAMERSPGNMIIVNGSRTMTILMLLVIHSSMIINMYVNFFSAQLAADYTYMGIGIAAWFFAINIHDTENHEKNRFRKELFYCLDRRVMVKKKLLN